MDPSPATAAASASDSSPFSGLPLTVLEIIADRTDPDSRHSLRAACRHARAAVNATARTLALSEHPALSKERRIPPRAAAGVRSTYPNVKNLILKDHRVQDVLGAPDGGGSGGCGGGRCPAVRFAAGCGSSACSGGGGGGSGGAGGSSTACSCSDSGCGGAGLSRSSSHSSFGSWVADDGAAGCSRVGSEAGGSRPISRAASGVGLYKGGRSAAGGSSCCLSGSDGAGCCPACACAAGWRHAAAAGSALNGGMLAALRPGAHVWSGLQRVELRFEALTDASARQLACAAPGISELCITVDPAAQHPARSQARRVAALRHFPSLRRLSCRAPLGPDALRALRSAAGARLEALALDVLPRQHCPGACLEELCRFEGLKELAVAYTAGRTLRHAAPLAALKNLERLHVWVGSYQAAPPWSSRPLPDLLPAVATLTRLTELRLLQGLRRSPDVQQLALATWLPRLVDLGLHDTTATPDEMIVLARCRALTHLAVDGLQLSGSCQGVAAMPQLRRLRCNVMSLGWWTLEGLFPGLVQLGPFKETLGPQGYGVSMPLCVLEGNHTLQSLTLMLGALHGPGGARSAADAVRALATLPALAELELVGLAGGFAGCDGSGGCGGCVGGCGGSADLAMAVVELLGAGRAAAASPPLRRLTLAAWAEEDGGAEGAAALRERALRAAPAGLDVMVRRGWAG